MVERGAVKKQIVFFTLKEMSPVNETLPPGRRGESA